MDEASQQQTVCAVDAQVICCAPLCREHIQIELALPDFPESQPGQFLQLLCRPSDDPEPVPRAWSVGDFASLSDKDMRAPRAFLRRPFSIADRWCAADGLVHLRVISRAVGSGTRWLERLRPGDSLNLTGPLGCGFRIPPPDVPVILIGGGVGIPPLLYLARRLHELGHCDVTGIFGARTCDLLPLRLAATPAATATPRPCVEFPGAIRFGAIIATDDGSTGFGGTVIDALLSWHQQRGPREAGALALACGPEGMLRGVATMTRNLGMACQLCIERAMGCGLGTCLSCVVRLRDESRPEGWRWALTCREGPVFERDNLLDYRVGESA